MAIPFPYLLWLALAFALTVALAVVPFFVSFAVVPVSFAFSLAEERLCSLPIIDRSNQTIDQFKEMLRLIDQVAGKISVDDVLASLRSHLVDEGLELVPGRI